MVLEAVANNHEQDHGGHNRDQLARRQRHEHLPVGPEEIGDDRHQQPRPQRHQRNKEQQGRRGGPALGVLTLGTLLLAVATGRKSLVLASNLRSSLREDPARTLYFV